MNISTLFFSFTMLLTIGIIVAFINLFTAPKRMFSEEAGVRNIFLVHLIAALLYLIGGIGSLVTGIIWIVTYLKH